MSDRSERLATIYNTAGWFELMSMLNEQIAEPKDKLYQQISSRPDILTKPMSIKLASTAKALENFKESLEDEIKLSSLNPKGQG